MKKKYSKEEVIHYLAKSSEMHHELIAMWPTPQDCGSAVKPDGGVAAIFQWIDGKVTTKELLGSHIVFPGNNFIAKFHLYDPGEGDWTDIRYSPLWSKNFQEELKDHLVRDGVFGSYHFFDDLDDVYHCREFVNKYNDFFAKYCSVQAENAEKRVREFVVLDYFGERARELQSAERELTGICDFAVSLGSVFSPYYRKTLSHDFRCIQEAIELCKEVDRKLFNQWKYNQNYFLPQ